MKCSNICCPLPASGERVRERGLPGVLECLSRESLLRKKDYFLVIQN
jgi:hypothetical protein